MAQLEYEELVQLVSGSGAAVRVRQVLQPAGGPGDKIYPPTYATGERADTKYVLEKRRVNQETVDCVLLDSVASQANRIEEALQSGWDDGVLNFPVVQVDFSTDPELADLGQISTLQAPHRIADAILRDSTNLEGNTLFRDMPEGRAFTEASWRNATAVYLLCPTALVFGVWDSTGPKGGMGAKFQRALTSEIVAIGAVAGAKVGSRLDPTGIQANVPIYHRRDDESDWTIEESEAKLEKGKPVLFSRKGAEGKGKPSSVNHSNIAPSIDTLAGGITFDEAVQTVVLSLPALRKLRFATDLAGKPLENREKAESAARVALAALGLAGVVHHRESGYDLRSRCLLVPNREMALEIVYADGKTENRSLSTEQANKILANAMASAEGLGLGWQREPVKLRPAPKLAALIKRSRAEAAAGGEADAG